MAALYHAFIPARCSNANPLNTSSCTADIGMDSCDVVLIAVVYWCDSMLLLANTALPGPIATSTFQKCVRIHNIFQNMFYVVFILE